MPSGLVVATLAPVNDAVEPDDRLEREQAARLIRVVHSLVTQKLRVNYLRTELSSLPIHDAVRVLEKVCLRARGTSPAARDFMVALSGLLHDVEAEGLVLALGLAVEQDPESPLRQVMWVRSSARPKRSQGKDQRDEEARVPDYGKGRTLTLGERKSLARKPSRKMFDKLMLDPAPSVIQNLLTNPMTTEDDVVRLAVRRPLRPEVIREIVRHPRWNVRRRVRLALVLNPYTPTDMGIPLVGLLIRSELRMAVEGPETNEEIRAAARSRLQQMKDRRP